MLEIAQHSDTIILHSAPAFEPKMEADRIARPSASPGSHVKRSCTLKLNFRCSVEVILWKSSQPHWIYRNPVTAEHIRQTNEIHNQINCSILLHVSIFRRNFYRPEFPKMCSAEPSGSVTRIERFRGTNAQISETSSFDRWI